jgi:hypothetical protein
LYELREALLHLATPDGDLGESIVVQRSIPWGIGYSPRCDDKLPDVREAALSILVFTIVRGSNVSKRNEQ